MRQALVPDDVFRQRLDVAIAEIEYWLGEIAPQADIARGPIDGGWRLAVKPHSAACCPFELVLWRDQHFDLTVDGLEHADLPLDPAAIPPLVKAIAEGRVVTRSWQTAATGRLVGVASLIVLADGSLWQRATTAGAPDPASGDPDLISSDRRYAPIMLPKPYR